MNCMHFFKELADKAYGIFAIHKRAERKKTEALQESEEKFRTLVEAACGVTRHICVLLPVKAKKGEKG